MPSEKNSTVNITLLYEQIVNVFSFFHVKVSPLGLPRGKKGPLRSTPPKTVPGILTENDATADSRLYTRVQAAGVYL